MSKTSPIVIPVLVDTTGVDRGINNVRNRLRGTSGSQSGFGSGGRSSQGVGQGGSGGGAITAAVAGAVAGRAVRGGVSGGRPSFMSEMRARREFYRSLDIRQSQYDPQRGGGAEWLRIEQAKTRLKRESEVRARERKQDRYTFEGYVERRREVLSRLEARRERMAAKAKQDFFSGKMGLRDATKYGLSRLGIPEFAAGRMAAGLAGPIGLGALGIGAAAAIGAAGSNFKTRQANLFSNFEQFQGTEYYGMARKNAMAYSKTDQIDWMTRFKIREKAAGGAVSGIFETLGSGFDAVSDFVADMFGGAKFETPKAWDANVASGGAIRIKN